MLFILLFYQKALSDCSFRSNLIEINNDTSLDDLKNEYRPLFLRLTSPGCPFSPDSKVHWEAAAELFPQVDFITIDCWENKKICGLFGYPINTPYHGFVLANTSEVYDNEDAKFGRPTGSNDIEKSPTKFVDVITKYANLYPISPPLANLVPMITDSFYKNAGDPIILLYNSKCYEEVPFLNAWSKAANEELVSNGDYPTIGLLDCSKYPDECQRWSRPYVVKTPRALVYSGKTGNFEILDSYNDITKSKIQNLITNANSLLSRPTPSPIPNPIPSVPSLAPGDYELLENTELQNRPLSEVKSKYETIFKAPEKGPCLDGNCGNDHIDGPTCEKIQPNPQDHESSLNVINGFRWLAGLPDDVKENEEWSTLCQGTAHTINRIGKVPPDHIIKDQYLTPTYCAQAVYQQVAKDSLLSENSNSCFESSYKLFKDEGSNNDGVVGHRRYLLHPNLKTVGFGFYPLKYEKFAENHYWIRPAVTVLRVKENDNIGYIENGVPSNLKFISWPSAGPFPISHLPSNWHISHPMFKNAELSDLEILVTRDDGIELSISRIVLEKSSLNRDALILIMSAEALSRCTILHKINVFVKNNKEKKFIRYSFELFDTNEYTEICFFDKDQSKCPSSITDNNNKFGDGKYGTAGVLSNAKNLVKIHVVEPIKLNEKLSFSAKQRFIVSGNKIDGTVHIGAGVVIDFQDPGDTDIIIDWNVKSKSVGKLDSALRAKSIFVQVLDETEETTLNNIVFYTGRETQCSISKSVLRGEKYDVYYTFGGSNYQYFLISSPSAAYENFIVGDAFNTYPDLEQDYPGTKISTLYEMKNQKSYKRVVRVFINPKMTDYITIDAFIQGTKKDYIFVKTGNIYDFFSFYCDYAIREVANSITFQDLSDRFSRPLIPYGFNLISYSNDQRQRCQIDNITIKNPKFNNVYSTDYFFPSVKGDDTAKARYPYAYVDQCVANEQNPNVFDTQKSSSSKIQTEIKIDGKHNEYIVKVDFKGQIHMSTLYKFITILPEEGAESNPYKFKFQNRDNSNDEYPISNEDFPVVYFENFKDVTIEHPIVKDGTNYISKFQFIKCGNVSFSNANIENQEPIDLGNKLVLSSSSDTKIDYGVPTKVVDLSADGDGTFHVPNIEAETLTVSNHQEFIEVKVNEKVAVDSSSLVLNNCELKENINIEIKKTKDSWPSVSLVDTQIKSGTINIDFNIKPESNSVSLLDDKNEIPYEEHVMIAGITSGCESLKSSTTLNNKGDFDLRCSTDNKNIIVARGKQPIYEEVVEDPVTSSTNDNESGNDDVITSNDHEGESTNDNPIEVPSNDVGDEESSNNGPNDPGKSDGKGGSFPVGGIVGIVIAVLVVVAAVIVAVVLVLKKKKNNDTVSSENEGDAEGEVGL